MEANEKLINTFSTRVRQMLLQYKELQKENNDLYSMVDERDAKIRELTTSLANAKKEYETLMMAKMLEITDVDLESAQKRIARLIRDVNKCINLLSDK
ncbi:MAG: hypothetical protein MR627_00265 [Prevotella sp.]|nr:hypothetical protein [Prevotella sp.]MDD6393806.1 hypothetical protein [Prevotella sp.]MDY2702673.1 hypothetical protein [Prevotella sp.]